jgi:hypothetical protein
MPSGMAGIDIGVHPNAPRRRVGTPTHHFPRVGVERVEGDLRAMQEETLQSLGV